MGKDLDLPPGRWAPYNFDFSSLDFQGLWAGRETANQVERGILRGLLPATAMERVLELGTGDGRLTDLLQSLGREYVGVDLEPRFLSQVAKRFGGDPGHRYLLGNALHLPFRDAVFSSAILFRVINFLPYPEAVLHEVYRILAPRGILIVSYNPKPSWATLVDDLRAAFHSPRGRSEESLTFGRSESARVLRSNFPTFTTTRRKFAALALDAGFHWEAERPCGFEDSRPWRKLSPRIFLALSLALSRLGGFPTRVIVLSKPERNAAPLPPLEEILACPRCLRPLSKTTWETPGPCPACGFVPGRTDDLLDLRWLVEP